MEQTEKKAKMWLENLGLLAETAGDDTLADANGWGRWTGDAEVDKTRIAVTVLMGGESKDNWDLYPERDAIIIGTQDMLLSRALNRGYGMSRYRWPVHFGLLNNDCLWVMDEVQLMGNGLATSTQLQLFQEKFWKPAVECHFLWMSATPAKGMFHTRDREDYNMAEIPENKVLGLLEEKTMDIPSLVAEKSVAILKNEPKIRSKARNGLLDYHYNKPGNFTLVVLNTVKSAQRWFNEIRAAIENQDPTEVILLHGRMRHCDRISLMNRILDFNEKQKDGKQDRLGLIVVATQVVEAGLDVSADYLWSEIAPWSSVIQRLGRLNRRGLEKQKGACAWFWESKDEAAEDAPNKNRIGPYEKKEIKAASNLLKSLESLIKSGKIYRVALDEVLNSENSEDARQITHNIVIRPPDLYDLFSTEPDIAGGFTNISQYVRDADKDADVQVFWGDFESKPLKDLSERRDILCRVQVYALRKFLETSKSSSWVWNQEVGEYERVLGEGLCPGMTILLAAKSGGYSEELGWTGNRDDRPEYGLAEKKPPKSFSDDDGSESDWLALETHLRDSEDLAGNLVRSLSLAEIYGDAVVKAAKWHDVGKAHYRWQGAIKAMHDRLILKFQNLPIDLRDDIASIVKEPEVGWMHLFAKFPEWNELVEKNLRMNRQDAYKIMKILRTRFEPGLRHEAASSLAAWQYWIEGTNELNALSVYLIAAHHGKVRTVLRSRDKDSRDIFGIRPGDKLPPVEGWISHEMHLDLSPKLFGSPGKWLEDGTYECSMPSWIAMVSELQGKPNPDDAKIKSAVSPGEPKNLGPFALAFLESLVVAADRRSSMISNIEVEDEHKIADLSI